MRKDPRERAPDAAPAPLSHLEKNRNHMSVVPLGVGSLYERDPGPLDPDLQQSWRSLERFRRLYEISTDGIKGIRRRIRTIADRPANEPETGRIIQELRSLVFDLQLRGQHLHELANRDALTGLFNRRYLDDSLPRELSLSQRRGATLCVVALDIDRFKRFNDSFGHEAGDLALRECARSMSANLRSGDIACRIGGDEFILVLPDCAADQARTLVIRLCELIKRLPLQHEGRLLDTVTLSAGVSEEVEGAWCARRLLRGADEALYAAKRTGGDRVVVHE